MMKDVHSAPKNIKTTVNGRKPLKSQGLLGLPKPADDARSEVEESRVWNSGEDDMIDFDAVTNSAMCQGIVSSVEDNDSIYFERMELDTHANVVVLGIN